MVHRRPCHSLAAALAFALASAAAMLVPAPAHAQQVAAVAPAGATVDVLLRDRLESPLGRAAADAIARRFPGTRVRPALDRALLARVEAALRADHPGASLPEMGYRAVRVELAVDPAAVAAYARTLPGVESATVSVPAVPAAPPVAAAR